MSTIFFIANENRTITASIEKTGYNNFFLTFNRDYLKTASFPTISACLMAWYTPIVVERGRSGPDETGIKVTLESIPYTTTPVTTNDGAYIYKYKITDGQLWRARLPVIKDRYMFNIPSILNPRPEPGTLVVSSKYLLNNRTLFKETDRGLISIGVDNILNWEIVA